MADSATADEIGQVIAEVLHPRHFVVVPGTALDRPNPAIEEVPWEIFQGRLLDAAQTRQWRSFLAWNLFWTDESGRSGEPILSVKFDAAAGQLYVVRGLHCYVWEGYDSGDNVILSRETTRWVRELVGTIQLERFAELEAVRRELAGLIFQAVVGVSRLPLTSVESPLPAFSLGRLGYFYHREPTAHADLLTRDLSNSSSWTEQARLLEFTLRATPTHEIAATASLFLERWQKLDQPYEDIPDLLRTLFNEVSLSPYTAFVNNALAFVQHLSDKGALPTEGHIDFLSYILRQLGRHLAAYDLVKFHHRGANYPDALLLDAALKRLLDLAERHPELFTPAAEDAEGEAHSKRLRRRGLRQGWMLRRLYEELPVPDQPTSPGENARVLPPLFPRVPEEQITQLGKREQRLFHGDPLDQYVAANARRVLRQSVQDLQHRAELRELGMAVFIDRPLGVFKSPAEPDRTLLLSHEAFSCAVAENRLACLAREPALLPEQEWRNYQEALREAVPIHGLSLSTVQCEERRVVSLADVRRAAEDFVLLRTTRQAVQDFLDQYDLGPLGARFSLDYLTGGERVLIVPEVCATGATQRLLAVYDGKLRKRLLLGFAQEQGYEAHGGHEFPAGGLRVLSVGDEAGAHDLRGEDLRLPSRGSGEKKGSRGGEE